MSDKLRLTAQALESYRLKSKKEDEEYFKNLVAKFEISEVVVGLPLRMDGSFGTRAKKTQEFAHWLEDILSLSVFFWDERLTTQQANRILLHHKRKAKFKKDLEDQISAVIILSTYLERKRVKADADQNR